MLVSNVISYNISITLPTMFYTHTVIARNTAWCNMRAWKYHYLELPFADLISQVTISVSADDDAQIYINDVKYLNRKGSVKINNPFKLGENKISVYAINHDDSGCGNGEDHLEYWLTITYHYK